MNTGYPIHKAYKIQQNIQNMGTPSTGRSDKGKPKLIKTLEKEEMRCRGNEAQLIENFKFYFDENTGKAIGFLDKRD